MYIYFCITKRYYFVNLTSFLRPNQVPLNVEITNENGIASPKHSHNTIRHNTNPFPRKTAAFQTRLFVSLDTSVSVILFHTQFSDDL